MRFKIFTFSLVIAVFLINIAIAADQSNPFASRDTYYIMGIPVYVLSGDPVTLFSDDLDGQDPGWPRWRFSFWKDPECDYYRYEEDPEEDPFTLYPGKGYWFVQDVVDNCVLDITSAQQPGGDGTLPEDQFHDISIYVATDAEDIACTMIANPFLYNYDWRRTYMYDNTTSLSLAAAVATGWTDGYLRVWRSNQYVLLDYQGGDAQNVSPWEGGFVNQMDHTVAAMKVRFRPNGYNPLLPGDGGLPKRDDEQGWALLLPIRTVENDFHDEYNKAAIDAQSCDDLGARDASEFNPPISQYVQLYFDHPEWERGTRLTYDYRSLEFNGEKVWDFTVKAVNLPNRDFALTWPNIDQIDQSYSFILHNVDNGEEICNLRDRNEYVFAGGEGIVVEVHLRLVVTHNPDAVGSDPDCVVNRYNLLAAYPNPFNNETRVNFVLPNSQYASLKVLDILGREIETISQGHYDSGSHIVTWNATNQVTGTYFLKLDVDGKVVLRQVILSR
jgi:hypothetical protein